MQIINNVMLEKQDSVYAWKKETGFIRNTVVPERTIELIKDVAQYVCQQLKIGDNYTVVLGYDSKNERSNIRGEYTHSNRVVWLNMHILLKDEYSGICNTVAHELLHAEQHIYVPSVFKGYVHANDNYEAYKNHESEKQAREYGEYVAALFKKNKYNKPLMMAI